ncbi:MAG: 50S ribosomal protein L10 [Actinobacteria bacterium]|nr:50S ribosomal protein L10 [Actinomycetota bacterium]
MPSAKNIELLKEIEAKLQENRHFIIAEYKGLTVEQMTKLRRMLREADSEVKVIKNTLFEIALKNLNLPSIDDYLVGPNAVFYIKEDPVLAAKKIVDFAKENEALKLKCGVIEGHIFDAKKIEALSKLPSREELIAKLLYTLKAPLYGLAAVAIGPVRGLAIALSEIAKQKEGQ